MDIGAMWVDTEVAGEWTGGGGGGGAGRWT